MVVVVVVVVVAVVPFCLQQLATTGLFILFSSSPGRRSTASLCTFSSSRSSLPARLSSTRQAKAGVARDPPHPLFNALLVSVACCGVACGPACGSRLLPAASILWAASSGVASVVDNGSVFQPHCHHTHRSQVVPDKDQAVAIRAGLVVVAAMLGTYSRYHREHWKATAAAGEKTQ